MLKWIGGPRPDHPLADATRARELLGALSPYDPPKALDEIRDWIDSVMRTEGFQIDDRIGLVNLLDETGQAFHRKLLRDYLAAPRLQKYQEFRQWSAASSFWKELGFAYQRCLSEVQNGVKLESRTLFALAACRGLRAVAQQLKWLQLRYGPLDDNAWATLSDLYRFALARGVDQQLVELYPGLAGETTPERELFKVLMLWIAAPDTLSPQLVEIAERLTSQYASAFVLERAIRRTCSHSYDLAGRRPPGRAAAGSGGPTLLFFGPGNALEQMEGDREKLVAGTVPKDINLGASYPAAAVLEALEHLALHWAPKIPERHFVRHKIQARLTVISTLERLIEELGGEGSLNFEGIESWVIEDVSAGGFGAVVPEMKPEWIRVGALIGTRPEGVARWGVGIIRRLKRDARNQGYVGVQTLSRETQRVMIKPVGAPWGGGLPVDGAGYLAALWLADGGGEAGEATLVMRASTFSPTQSLEMLREDRKFLLLPRGLEEHGDDYDLARFRAMQREDGDPA
jgi:hypothetical protein